MHVIRGKNSGLQAVILAASLESRYLPGAIFNKKQTVSQVIVTLLHSPGVGVLCDEDWVVNMGVSEEELMNSSLLRQCSWLSSIFYDARGCVIWGYLDVPPCYKKTADVTPQLKVAPVA
jgi:hypothetical protein